MKMRTINVEDATKPQLDWLAACIELRLEIAEGNPQALAEWKAPEPFMVSTYRPTTSPALADIFIDRERISCVYSGPADSKLSWIAWGRDTPEGDRNPDGYGSTRIEAATAAWVALNYRLEVEVPEDLR